MQITANFPSPQAKEGYAWYLDGPEPDKRYPKQTTVYTIPEPDSDTAKAETYLAAEVPLDGDGSKEHPYEISKAEELAAFRDIVNGSNGGRGNPAACAKLMGNITIYKDLLGDDGEPQDGRDLVSWEPIGTSPLHRHL